MRQPNYDNWTNEKKAKEYAVNLRGHSGEIGGWIRDKDGWPIVQGWTRYYGMFSQGINRYIRLRKDGVIDKYGKKI